MSIEQGAHSGERRGSLGPLGADHTTVAVHGSINPGPCHRKSTHLSQPGLAQLSRELGLQKGLPWQHFDVEQGKTLVHMAASSFTVGP